MKVKVTRRKVEDAISQSKKTLYPEDVENAFDMILERYKQLRAEREARKEKELSEEELCDIKNSFEYKMSFFPALCDAFCSVNCDNLHSNLSLRILLEHEEAFKIPGDIVHDAFEIADDLKISMWEVCVYAEQYKLLAPYEKQFSDAISKLLFLIQFFDIFSSEVLREFKGVFKND